MYPYSYGFTTYHQQPWLRKQNSVSIILAFFYEAPRRPVPQYYIAGDANVWCYIGTLVGGKGSLIANPFQRTPPGSRPLTPRSCVRVRALDSKIIDTCAAQIKIRIIPVHRAYRGCCCPPTCVKASTPIMVVKEDIRCWQPQATIRCPTNQVLVTGSAVALHCVKKAHRQSQRSSPNFNPL